MSCLFLYCFLCILTTPTINSATVGIDLQVYPEGLVSLKENQGDFIVQLQLSEVIQINKVNITCMHIARMAGDTRLKFSNVIAPVGTQKVLYNGSIISTGRVSQVQCKGTSLNGGYQYHPSNSSGAIVRVIAARAPTISICQDSVVVQGYNNGQQYVTVRLSEKVADFPVIVECSAHNITSDTKNLILEFTRISIGILQNEAKVPFRVISPGTSVGVTCSAWSSNCAHGTGFTSSTILLTSSLTLMPSSSLNLTTTSSMTYNISQSLNTTMHMDNQSTTYLERSMNFTLGGLPSPTVSFTTNISSSNFSSTSVSVNITRIISVFPIDFVSTNTLIRNISVESLHVKNASIFTQYSKIISNISQVSNKSVNSTIGMLNSSVTGNYTIPLANFTRNFSVINMSQYSNFTNVSLSTQSKESLYTYIYTTTTLPGTPAPTANRTQCQYKKTTSQGPAVIFVLEDTNITPIPPYSHLNSLSQEIVLIVLNSALAGTESLEINCKIREIDSSQSGAAVCNMTDGTPLFGGTQVLVGDTTIRIKDPKLIFKASETYKSITVEVQNVGNASDPKLLQLLCCASKSSKYNGTSIEFLLWTSLQSTQKLNWMAVPVKGSAALTPVTNIDTSCPCNMKIGHCDLNCCCDKDCSSTEKASFTCIQGPSGGNSMTATKFNCRSSLSEDSDLHPVVCVLNNNNPFLGYFFPYTNPAITTDIVSFETLKRIKSKQSLFSYEENEARTKQTTNTIGYLFGSPIKTTTGTLTLPRQHIGTDSCIFDDLRFLFNHVQYCAHDLTEAVCAKAEIDANTFVVPTILDYPSCPTSRGVLAEGTGNKLVDLAVEYYCTTDISSFVYSNDSVKSTQNISVLTEEKERTRPLVNRCEFDDGRTMAPRPKLNKSSSVCENAVVGVDYAFSWNGMTLKKMRVKLTLATLPLRSTKLSTFSYTTSYITTVLASSASVFKSSITGSVSTAHNQSLLVNQTTAMLTTTVIQSSSVQSTVIPSVSTPILNYSTRIAVNTSYIIKQVTIKPTLAQRLTISFQYVTAITNSSATVSSTAATRNGSATPSSRSGNPGYVIGKPVFTQTPDEVKNVNFSTVGILVWKSTKEGVCSRFLRSPIPFGKDVISGCNVRIYLDDLKNCSVIRNKIFQVQEEMAAAIHVAKRGNPSATISEDWLNITRISPNLTVSRREALGECLNIPAHLRFEILISEAGKFFGRSQMEISGVRISYLLEQWKFSCSPGMLSACIDKNTAANKGLKPQFQDFSLTTTVRFIQIPIQEPAPVKRSMKNDTVCKFDSCLRELFFPFQLLYGKSLAFLSDNNPTTTMLSFGLALILVAVGTLVIAENST